MQARIFYVLTSHNIYALKRQFRTLDKEDTTVIINTLDKEHQAAAEAYCEEEGIRCFITDSDGTAATGKNSFLDQFEKDENDYSVLIDGDDYLTNRGVKFYKELAASDSPPDAVVLSRAITVSWPDNLVTRSLLVDSSRQHLDPDTLPMKTAIAATVVDWSILKKGGLLGHDNLAEAKPDFKEYISLLEYGMGIDELAARVVFMSKKTLQVRYNKDLIVGEDTFQYLELKDLHEREVLTLVYHDESRPTYMYDGRISGVAVATSYAGDGVGFIKWMRVLLAHMKGLKEENRLHNRRIQEWHTVYNASMLVVT